MPKDSNYFKIGFFTILALFLLASGIIFFGVNSIFKTKLECETYFDQSVQGLTVGSQVLFRGFKVGQISSISLSRVRNSSGKQLVRVDFYLDPSLMVDKNDTSSLAAREYLEKETKAGLRAFLSFQGVTGVSFLDLDYTNDPKSPDPPQSFSNKLIIPNAPGSVLEIGESITEIVKSFRKINFDALGHELQKTLEGFSHLSTTLDQETLSLTQHLSETLTEVKDTAMELGSLSKELSRDVKGLDLQKSTRDLNLSLAKLKDLLSSTDHILKAPQASLPATLDNLRMMSENLLELSELAKKYPSQILFGQPPTKVAPYRNQKKYSSKDKHE